ncbi:f-box DNA helicase (plasmid) [Candidatus Photodesmus katoptron]|uniref:UvrD-helicase domain-containing protein n=1 Tax=Candidatus Photodesmus anomalopis TaxID=28176 RepID=UPI0004D53D2B|nr:UvrD-helicase domain-containing protein [Candidatus Photodesmus katoptron]KEY90059.1 f-box DNA helicase [Candidatus Photodesmus katoptron]
MFQYQNVFIDGKKLSCEQFSILEEVKLGKNLIINAFAGTGKTFILRAISLKVLSSKSGLYLAFNRKIVNEATAVFTKNVSCRTIHSLAYKDVGIKYFRVGRMNQFLNAAILHDAFFKNTPAIFGILPIRICGMILSGIQSYCDSSDAEISVHHLNKVNFSDIDKNNIHELKETLFYFLKSIWSLIRDLESSSKLPITPNIYLKLWALKEPKLFYDYILIDEAQDQNPVVIDLLSKQNHLQQIWVGDKYQQIYEFRGAKNALDSINIDNHYVLTKSFRYGKEIAEYCNLLLSTHFNDNPNIRGLSKIKSVLSNKFEPDVVICRSNFALIAEVVYQSNFKKKKVFINAYIHNLIYDLQEAEKIIRGKISFHPDFIPFKNWSEIVRFSKTSEGYHLKTVVNLIKEYNTSFLIELISKVKFIRESHADLIVSTVHQAKGREWNIVRLADDFKLKGSPGYNEEEGRLLYVAATRAKKVLDISFCSAASSFLEHNKS